MDREKVIIGLKCLITDDVPCDGCPYYGSGYCIKNIASDAITLLKEQPDIVRCRDCKFKQKIIKNGVPFTSCELKRNWSPLPPDWFCADGERKEQPDV